LDFTMVASVAPGTVQISVGTRTVSVDIANPKVSKLSSEQMQRLAESLVSRLESAATSANDQFLAVQVPEGFDAAEWPALSRGMEKMLAVAAKNDLRGRLMEQADSLAAALVGQVQPDAGLYDERIRRRRTLNKIIGEGDWLTARQIHDLQANPPADAHQPAADWKRRGRIFSVNDGSGDLYPAYQFDQAGQPLSVIAKILKAYGPAADPWTLAAWFHYPNPWLVQRTGGKAANLAPRNALDHADEVIAAALRHAGTYVA
jgi:hypothetical protein